MTGLDHPTATQLDLIAGHFGKRLKHWRRTRQLTQAELARDLGLDGSYVSKLESSRRRPSLDLAEQCDRLLDTGGELADLLGLVTAEPGPPQPAAGPAAAAPLPAVAPTVPLPAAAPTHAAAALSRLAEAYAEVDATMGGAHLGAAVERLAQEVVALHLGGPETVAAALLRTAARFARLAATIRADAGDDTGYRYWSDCAGRWAADAGDASLAAEICARTAIGYAHAGDPAIAATLAARAEQLAPHSPTATVWSLLAQAHAHAAAAEAAAAHDRLTAAEALLPRMDCPLMAAPSTQTDDYLWHWYAGSCHLVLADHGNDRPTDTHHALRHLRAALSEASVYHSRNLALTRLSLARAHLHDDDPDAAAAELAEAAALARTCASPRLHTELAATRSALADHGKPGARPSRDGS